MIIPYKEKMKAKRIAEEAERKAAEQVRIQKEKEILAEQWKQEGLAQMEQEVTATAKEAEKIDRGLDDTLAEIELNKKIRVEEQVRAAERYVAQPKPKPKPLIAHGINEGLLYNTSVEWLPFSTHPDIINLPMPEKIRLFKKAERQRADRLSYMQANVLGGGSQEIIDKYSLTFNGLTNEVTTTFSGSGATPLNKTYSWWMKSTVTSRNYAVFGYGSQKREGFTPNFSNGRALIWNGASWYVYWDASSVDHAWDGGWHHWMCYNDVMAITSSKLYVDGTLIPVNKYVTAGTVDNLNNQTQPLTMGSYQNNSNNHGRHFEGSLDEFSIFSGDKTSNASTYYNNGTPYDLTNESDLQGYWRFDEGTGTIANDSSGQGNHGTVFATWSLDVPK